MSVNIKLGQDTIEGIDTVKVPLADDSGNLAVFNLAPENVYTVSFAVDGETYTAVQVQQGEAVAKPVNPSKTGNYFTGWYTASTGGTKVVFPYTPAADVTLYAQWTEQVVVGFTGLTNSTGSLTWTDDIASASGYQTTAEGSNVVVTGELDEIFPFSQITEMTDSSDNVFVKFPKVWMKWVLDGSGNIDGVKFSNVQADSDYFIPDCFLDPKDTTYSTYLDYFALGKYEASGSSSKMYSKASQTCLANITRANARTAARAYGTSSNYYNGYQLTDVSMLVVYNLLCNMYYKTANIQTVYGGRTGSGTHTGWSSAENTGSCDGISGLNGWNTLTDCVKMLGIENPYGNISKWIDGIYFSSQTIYVHRLPQQFADSTTLATTLGFSRPSSSGYIKYLRKGTSDATKSYAYCYDASGTDSTYFGDQCYYGSTGVVLCSGGSWVSTAYAGLWYLFGGYSATSSDTSIGARLSYRPL